MSASRNVGIFFGSLLLLAAIAVAGGAFWWRAQGPALRAEIEAAAAEAAVFGKATDERGCLEESLERLRACEDGFTCNLMSHGFLLSCLKVSAASAGFCKGVPGSRSIAGSVAWRLERCEEHGLASSYCGNFFGQLQKHCESRQTGS